MEREEFYYGYCRSPIGVIEVKGTDVAVRSVDFVERRREGFCCNGVVDEAVQEIEQYFTGKRQNFGMPLDLQGTPFQRAVWKELLKIPYGGTVSYGDIARAIGNPKAVRAVGGANHRNPAAIVVPCHRVIGSDGSMTGYGSGIWRKEWLLKHESGS